MASIEKALQIAARAHEGQKDKDGQPYILHPLRVMNAVEDEPAKVVAVLHDVIEVGHVYLRIGEHQPSHFTCTSSSNSLIFILLFASVVVFLIHRFYG